MELGVPSLFDHLVSRVIDTADSDDPLARLAAAVMVAAEAAGAGDRLLDHFVAKARHADLSWTDIGARLGVSKQAARQRFADRTQPLILAGAAEPDSRLRACLARAGAVAQADGAAEIDTHHLLAGLLAEGVAAAILERLGVTADGIGESGHRLFGSPRTPPDSTARDDVPAMSAEATGAVDTAARHALSSSPDPSCPEVRTEHLLFVLALDPGSRARRVLNDLGTDIAAIKKELQCYVTGNPRRRGSRGKRPAAPGRACSFCGRSEKIAGRLVAGPGVHICGGCVALAGEILDREAPEPPRWRRPPLCLVAGRMSWLPQSGGRREDPSAVNVHGLIGVDPFPRSNRRPRRCWRLGCPRPGRTPRSASPGRARS